MRTISAYVMSHKSNSLEFQGRANIIQYLDHSVGLINGIEDVWESRVIFVLDAVVLQWEREVVNVGHLQQHLPMNILIIL